MLGRPKVGGYRANMGRALTALPFLLIRPLKNTPFCPISKLLNWPPQRNRLCIPQGRQTQTEHGTQRAEVRGQRSEFRGREVKKIGRLDFIHY